MAIIGVSQIMFAKYSNAGTTVTYSDGGVMGRATSVDVSIEVAEDNGLFADNILVETDRSFSSGKLITGVDDFPPEIAKAVLGLKEVELGDIAGITDAGGKELICDDDLVVPYLGVGFIIMRKYRGVLSWRAVVFPKVMYSIPQDSASTKGKTIEWQTPKLEASILRDDTANHAWKRESTFTTEDQAAAYLRNRLNITEVPA